MLVKNALLMGTHCVDMQIENGIILTIYPSTDSVPSDNEAVIDANGYILLPPLCDMHLHLDKTFLGLDWFHNDLGPSIQDRIKLEREKTTSFGLDRFTQSSRLIELLVSMGTQYIRSHVDIDTDNGLDGVAGLLAAREKYKDICFIELVAFPQSGLVNRPGTYELMAEALKMGVDIVGGIDPAIIDRDPKRSINAIFDLAENHAKPVDIHLHEMAELGAFSMELIIEQTLARGMQKKVCISHAFCLGNPNQALVGPLIENIAKADIAITSGGQAYIPFVPSVKQLSNAGILVCTGNDNIRDIWAPYGTGDMLERTQLVSMRNGFRRDDDLEYAMNLCMENGAKLSGAKKYGLVPGNSADFLLVKGRNIPECVVTCPKDRMVFKKGKMLAKDGIFSHSRLTA